MAEILHKKILVLAILLLSGSYQSFSKHPAISLSSVSKTETIYRSLHLDSLGLKQSVFEKALKGWQELKQQNRLKSNILSISDLSQSSNSKRLYVIDLEEKKLLFHTYVAHGRNSGQEYASSFSNTLNSFKTSLGFYVTESTYTGTHGLCLRLKGLEKGINDIAEQRGIVIHGAPYVSESFIKNFGRLGRSQGCPAITEDLCEPIITSIKEGCLLYTSPSPRD